MSMMMATKAMKHMLRVSKAVDASSDDKSITRVTFIAPALPVQSLITRITHAHNITDRLFSNSYASVRVDDFIPIFMRV